jgi:glycosyltransferase involved in cell wall biosynthesis
MRILHLLSSPVWSGPAESMALLAQAQRAAGHAVSVAIDSTRAGTGTEEPAAPVLKAMGLSREAELRLCTHDGPFALWRDARRLAQRSLDVVHAHFSHDHWIARFGRPRGAVVVRSVHAPRSLEGIVPRAEAFTVPTRDLGARLQQPWRLLPPLVAPAFVPPADRTALQASLGLSAPVVGMVSTFQRSRRHDLALTALVEVRRRVPTATLALVGDGELRQALSDVARNLGIAGAVRFPGYQRQEGLVRWMQAFDELWVLGLGNDWAGRAAAQGRAVGARVVAVAEGGLPDWADAVLTSEEPGALPAVALRPERAERLLPDVGDVARDLLALYRDAGARG